MKQAIDPLVTRELQAACQNVAACLPDLTQLSQEQERKIMKRYVAAFEGNFVVWMAAAIVSTRSLQGRYAASENLIVEVRDDHPGMLREFARSMACEPDACDYASIFKAVGRIRQMVSRLSGLECLTLMATIENTSAIFVPWMEKVAKELGSTNLRYLLIHGEADVEHANQFAWAVSQEMIHHQNGEEIFCRAVEQTVDFLKAIFCDTKD